ncbi:MAG: phage tail tape measure protein [Pseudomonadota bacterium]
MTTDSSVTIAVNADTTQFETALDFLEKKAKSFGNTLTRALKSLIVDGKSFGDVMRNIALSMSASALNASLKPLGNLLNAVGSRVFRALAPVTPFAQGGVIGSAGSVLSQPTYFPMGAGKTGLAGEAGAEAILPLSRMPDGRLGVASGSGSAAPPVSVTVNIQTPDAASFRNSEAQVSAAIARAVQRGQRSL